MNSRKIKTIIVDDESRIRRGIEKMVLAAGEEWQVVAVYGDGRELLEAYDKQPIDFNVLITDIRMPSVDGLTLIREMKKRTAFNPVVISGFDDFSYLQTAMREGALDYILKPIDRVEFKKQLEALKEKIMNQWKEQEREEEVKAQTAKFAYMKQVEKLSEVSKGFELEVSLFDWTKDFPEGNYMLVYISIDQSSNYSRLMSREEWITWMLANENIIEEMLAESGRKFWKWRGEDSSWWILLCSNENEEIENFRGKIYNFTKLMQKNVLCTIPLSNSMAISRSFTELALLQPMSRDVLSLMQYRPVFGSSQILQQEMNIDLQQKSEIENTGELQQFILKIIQALENMNEKELKKQLSQFVDGLQSLRLSSEVEFFLQSLSIQLINYGIKFTPRLNTGLLNLQDTADLLKKAANMDELRTEMEKMILDVFQKLSVLDKEKVHDEVQVAKQWILENLKENITIEKIASHIYMNPTYFCEFFKSETGETVLDFVTRSRIYKARGLLLGTNLKIYEISEQVGYADTKYFSKLFKKHYGELPSKYRENLMRPI
ncbi:response regulator [Planomicrobium sp. Y74]|uniref:response regulator transcription factor n=1 Tax=Planomicrobium sp. Y74 TaxID=2478977 RepID=UPI000EF5197B|nr:response regulator [Planomicrobium sp. Y74]RLQ90185.1 response regulator [Planomicrobium sp. Y74]